MSCTGSDGLLSSSRIERGRYPSWRGGRIRGRSAGLRPHSKWHNHRRAGLARWLLQARSYWREVSSELGPRDKHRRCPKKVPPRRAPDRRTSPSNLAPYRGMKFDAQVRRSLIQLCLFGFGSDQPEVGEAFDLPDANQLLTLGPIECRKEPLAPEPSFLLRGALRRRAGIKGPPDQLLIDHPDNRAVRCDRQINPLLGQDRHQHSFQPQCGRALILALGFSPRIIRPGLYFWNRPSPVHHHRGDRLAILVGLRRRHLPQHERVFLALAASAVFADRQPGNWL